MTTYGGKIKKREFSIYVLAIILVYLVNIFMFFINVNNVSYPFKKDINCYSFWEYSTHNGILTVFMFLLPIIISLITIKNINTKIYGSYLRNYLIRDDYKKLIKKEYLSCLVKTITPYVIISILIFIFGFIFLKHDITNIKYADLYSNFIYDPMFSPPIVILLETIISIIFFISLVNIELIIYRVIKKLGLTIIFSFVSINVLNFITSYLFKIISPLINNKYISEALYSFNIYHGFIGTKYIMFTLVVFSLICILSFILLKKMYSNKERMILDFEQ